MNNIIKSGVAILILGNFLLFATSCECIQGEGKVAEQTRTVSGFDRIALNIGADLYLTQGDSYNIKLSAQQNILDAIKTDKMGSDLKIHSESMCLRSGEPIKIWITLPQLTSVKLNGSGNLLCDSTFKVNSLELEINGSGDIRMNTDAISVTSSIHGSGDIYLKGKAQESSASIMGSGKIIASDLVAAKTDASITGSGEIRVNTTDQLEASITGSGSIYYKGDPQVKSKVSGSGTVEKVR